MRILTLLEGQEPTQVVLAMLVLLPQTSTLPIPVAPSNISKRMITKAINPSSLALNHLEPFKNINRDSLKRARDSNLATRTLTRLMITIDREETPILKGIIATS